MQLSQVMLAATAPIMQQSFLRSCKRGQMEMSGYAAGLVQSAAAGIRASSADKVTCAPAAVPRRLRAAPTAPAANGSASRLCPAGGGAAGPGRSARGLGSALPSGRRRRRRSSPGPAERVGGRAAVPRAERRPPPPPSCLCLAPLHRERHVTELGRQHGIVGALKAAAARCPPPPTLPARGRAGSRSL